MAKQIEGWSIRNKKKMPFIGIPTIIKNKREVTCAKESMRMTIKCQ